MWLKKFIEFIYDEELLPITRENYANYVTLIGAWLTRISLVMFIVLLFLFIQTGQRVEWLRYIAIVLTILGSICDALDGVIARKYNCVTDFGKIFDPHHDKMQHNAKINSLLIDAFIVALMSGKIWYFLFAILIKCLTDERDGTIGFHRLWAAMISPEIQLSARQSGKWRTRICFVCLPLLHLLIAPIDSFAAFMAVSFVVIGSIIISYIDYVLGYRNEIKKYMRDHKKGEV